MAAQPAQAAQSYRIGQELFGWDEAKQYQDIFDTAPIEEKQRADKVVREYLIQKGINISDVAEADLPRIMPDGDIGNKVYTLDMIEQVMYISLISPLFGNMTRKKGLREEAERLGSVLENWPIGTDSRGDLLRLQLLQKSVFNDYNQTFGQMENNYANTIEALMGESFQLGNASEQDDISTKTQFYNLFLGMTASLQAANQIDLNMRVWAKTFYNTLFEVATNVFRPLAVLDTGIINSIRAYCNNTFVYDGVLCSPFLKIHMLDKLNQVYYVTMPAIHGLARAPFILRQVSDPKLVPVHSFCMQHNNTVVGAEIFLGVVGTLRVKNGEIKPTFDQTQLDSITASRFSKWEPSCENNFREFALNFMTHEMAQNIVSILRQSNIDKIDQINEHTWRKIEGLNVPGGVLNNQALQQATKNLALIGANTKGSFFSQNSAFLKNPLSAQSGPTAQSGQAGQTVQQAPNNPGRTGMFGGGANAQSTNSYATFGAQVTDSMKSLSKEHKRAVISKDNPINDVRKEFMNKAYGDEAGMNFKAAVRNDPRYKELYEDLATIKSAIKEMREGQGSKYVFGISNYTNVNASGHDMGKPAFAKYTEPKQFLDMYSPLDGHFMLKLDFNELVGKTWDQAREHFDSFFALKEPEKCTLENVKSMKQWQEALIGDLQALHAWLHHDTTGDEIRVLASLSTVVYASNPECSIEIQNVRSLVQVKNGVSDVQKTRFLERKFLVPTNESKMNGKQYKIFGSKIQFEEINNNNEDITYMRDNGIFDFEIVILPIIKIYFPKHYNASHLADFKLRVKCVSTCHRFLPKNAGVVCNALRFFTSIEEGNTIKFGMSQKYRNTVRQIRNDIKTPGSYIIQKNAVDKERASIRDRANHIKKMGGGSSIVYSR